jgi:outer membrane PBP1 activator LpoA protein
MSIRLKNRFIAGNSRCRDLALIRALPFLLALLLAACAGTDTSWKAEQDTGASAESAFAKGQYEVAASNWQKEALNAGSGEASSLRIKAADAWLLAGQPGKAQDQLRWIDRKSLSRQDQSRLNLVLADLALKNSRPDEAEILLRQARETMPGSSRKRYEGLYARMLQQLSSPGSKNIGQAAKLSDGMRFYDPVVAVDLVRSLENVSTSELTIRAENPRGERQLTGWLDLTRVIREYLVVPEGVARAVSDWKSRHPYHVLTEQQALDTWLRYRQLFVPPGKVAVLLPQSGRLQAAGDAIRDGVMSAYLNTPGGAEILFFTTGDDEQSAIAAYFNALDAGADLIIGPLRKESVEAMLNLAGMSTPLLALNDLPEGFTAPPGLAGQVSAISLSQDNEARAIARHAADSGLMNAMLLAPEDAWGERMAYAIESDFLQDDRQILAAARYLPAQNDHSSDLERLLKIDESKARKQQLQNTLQMTLEFEPVRRQDIDVIFLAANSSQARLIRPQLKFHDAGDIPVYATARIYSGQPNPSRNQDLNGMRFPATPWQLAHPRKNDIPALASIRQGSLANLFALGQDAWNLLPWLELMKKDPDFVFPGQSGYYQAANSDSLKREPAWAEFSRGIPIQLVTPEKPDTR